jgi:hypothetical protein
VVIYLQDLVSLLVAVVLVLILIAIVLATGRNYQQRVDRAAIEVRENAEMEQARTEIKELYRRAREEVERAST